MRAIKNKIVLVVGGTGAVGGDIVRKFLGAGAQVVVPSRSPVNLAALRLRLSDFKIKFLEKNLLLLECDVGTECGAARARDELLQHYERVDAVIDSIGGGWQGLNLLNVPLETWNEILHNNLTTHFVVAKNFLPVLLHQNTGAYIFIVGESGIKPVARSIPVCVCVAGQIMLAHGLALENRRSGVRIQTVILGAVSTKPGNGSVRDDFVTTEEIGEFIVELAACRTKFNDGKPISLADKKHLTRAIKELRASTAENR